MDCFVLVPGSDDTKQVKVGGLVNVFNLGGIMLFLTNNAPAGVRLRACLAS